jgi:hypothetical protein
MIFSRETRFKSIGKIVSRMALVAALFGLALLATPAWSHQSAEDHTHAAPIPSTVPPSDVCRKTTPPGPCDIDHARPEHGSLGAVGNKLSDPTANIWALAFNVQGLQFFDGDANAGDPELGGSVIFEPVMPFPFYGTGEDEWKLVTRPVIPILFSQPGPTGPDDFEHRGGIGDIELPLLINPSKSITGEGWILGAGPVFEFPTATSDALGNQQFAMGPAVVVGYKTKTVTAVLFPNYFFGIGSVNKVNSKETTSKLSMLYSLNYALPGAWQIGMNPTIAYNHKAGRGDKWNVPVGVYGGKTIKVGRMPVNIKLGVEYSVVSQDSFGKRAQIRLQLTPVIPGLVKNAIFGGK